MAEKIIAIYKKSKQARKLKGKYPALIIDSSLFYINSIFQFDNKKSKIQSQGFEFLLIKSKSAGNISHKKKETKFFFGKIIARSSSDLISVLASRLISELKISDLNLVQYPLYPRDSSKKLIILAEIPVQDVTIEILNNIQNVLNDFFSKFRSAMSKIIERNM